MEIIFEWQSSEFDSEKRENIERLLKLHITDAARRSRRNFSSLMVSMIEKTSPQFQLLGVVFAIEDGVRKEVMQLEIDGDFRIEFKKTSYNYP